ncbi:MAG: alpha/beta hydrolase-fold protein [Flavobacteriales bacterium]|nr:alpha/beta hydrolase-fold protein [Flavobacteriales bacterium]
MKQTTICFILLFTVNLSCSQVVVEKISENEFTIGKAIKIKSPRLDETRNLNIYIPQSYYQDSLKSYPVIYLLDGSRDEDFIHISGIVQFGSFNWINILPESIVVGIGNVDRNRDFTYPSQNKLDQKEFPTSGRSENFIAFIEEELQPFIDSSYRTTEMKTVIGQSLGGLLVTEILFRKPNLFDNYVLVSPSLWWDDERILGRDLTSFGSIKSVYIAVGKEGELMERTAKELFEKLKKNLPENTSLYFEFLEDKTHGDALHIAAYSAFEKIFKHK